MAMSVVLLLADRDGGHPLEIVFLSSSFIIARFFGLDDKLVLGDDCVLSGKRFAIDMRRCLVGDDMANIGSRRNRRVKRKTFRAWKKFKIRTKLFFFSKSLKRFSKICLHFSP